MKKKIILSIIGLLVLVLAFFVIKSAIVIKNNDKETPIIKYLKPLTIKEKVIVLYNYIKIETGGKKSALKTLDKLIEKNPDVGVYYYLRGLTDYLICRVDDFTHAIDLIPNDSNLYMYRGIANHFSGNLKESELDFERAIELEANNPKIYEQRAYKRWREKNFEGELQDIKKAIELDKANEYLLYEFYGDKAQRERDYATANENYIKAVQFNKKTNTSYIKRALCYLSQEDFKKGFDDLKSAIKRDKYDVNSYIFMEMFQRATAKDYKKAIKYASIGIELGGEEFPFLYFDRADSKVALSDFEGAMKDYQKTIEINPDDAESYEMMSALERDVFKNYDKALEYIDKAIEINPDDVQYFISKSLIYAEKEGIQKTVEYLEGLIKSGHKDGKIYNQLAQYQAGNKDYKNAILNCDNAIKFLDKDDEHLLGLIYLIRGVSKRESGDNKGAIEDLTFAIEKSPEIEKYDMLFTMLGFKYNSAIPYYHRGVAEFNIQDYKNAEEDFEKSIVNKNEFNSYYFLGLIQYRLGNYKEAIPYLNKAISLKPDFEWAYQVRGDAKFGLKDYQGAKSDLEKALELNPNGKEAREILEKIEGK